MRKLIFITLFTLLAVITIGLSLLLAECPEPGDMLYVENTSCQLLYTSSSAVQLWCPTENGLYSMSLLAYSCDNNTMRIGDGFREIAICFQDDKEWACYQPMPRIATLTPERRW